MQSPFVASSHPQSPYAMAQMFLTSPTSGNQQHEQQHSGSHSGGNDYRQQRKHGVTTAHGILTPGKLTHRTSSDHSLT